MPLTVGSLFAGIGGFDLGFARAGFAIRWQVEIDPFCRAVLAQHWPDVRRYEDVRTCHSKQRADLLSMDMVASGCGDAPSCPLTYHGLEAVDVLVGGFPCQPHSLAGRRTGSADDRDLWPEFARLIRELRPRWVVAENVHGLLSSEHGRFFGRVLGELAACGYDAEWGIAYRLPPSAPLTRGIASGLLPTPTGEAYGTSNNGSNAGRPSTGKPSLQRMAGRNLWPTPQAQNAHHGGRGSGPRRILKRLTEGRQIDLQEAVKLQVLWPTPDANLGSGGRTFAEGTVSPTGKDLRTGRKRTVTLNAAIKLWPTPTSGDAKASGSRNAPTSRAHPGVSLTDAVRGDGGVGRTWPTPRAEERNQANSADNGMALSRAVKLWPSPAATDWKGQYTPATVNARALASSRGVRLPEEVAKREQNSGALNPTWVEWLMGYPLGWTACADWVTALSRRSRNGSHAGSRKRK